MTNTQSKALETAALYLEQAGQSKNKSKELEGQYLALLELLARVWDMNICDAHAKAQRIAYEWDNTIYHLRYYEIIPNSLLIGNARIVEVD